MWCMGIHTWNGNQWFHWRFVPKMVTWEIQASIPTTIAAIDAFVHPAKHPYNGLNCWCYTHKHGINNWCIQQHNPGRC